MTSIIDERPSEHAPPKPRSLGRINWLGFWTLYLKEVRRFMNVATQTVLAPVVTTLLFLAIFTLALGRAAPEVGGVTYAQFLAPGLVMMSMIQNAFANTSSSILISKVQGNIVDVLMPPLNAAELTMAYALGGVTRGIVVGISVALAMWIFVPMQVHDPLAILFFAVSASLMLSLIGLIGGIWADKFDHIAAVQNFAVMPLSFLSGTFYSIDRLPENWRFVADFNPFFYNIDGLRYGFIGHADGSILIGAGVSIAINAFLLALAYLIVARGYKLKA